MIRNISEVRASAYLLLDEANICANHSPKVLGFAAMMTTLSCVIAFGEALIGKANIEKSIEAFCGKMTNYDWLLNAREQRNSVEVLTSIRNGLAHVLSIPNNICLIPTTEDFEVAAAHKGKIGIVPSLLVHSVQETIDNIEKTCPNLNFDNDAEKKKRSLVMVQATTSKSTQ
jgi:hypothetical protein